MNKTQWSAGAVFLAIVAFFGTVSFLTHQTGATGETIGGGAPVTARVNQQVGITDIVINGSGNDTIPVKLSVDSGNLYVTETSGLTFTGNHVGSTISFTGTRSNVNAALATLHYAGTSTGSKTLQVSLSDGNTIYNPTNGHVYQYIPNSLNWYDARDAAAASSYGGAPGYLATITSQNENDFMKDRLSGDAWLGASDDDQYMGEGHWSWIAGPEAGTNFYNGEGSAGAGGGAAVGGAYTNWAGPDDEPNNAGGNEDCMETYISDGTWNDLPCTATVSGYVVEYGDGTHSPGSIPTKDVTITVSAAVFTDGDGSSGHPYVVTDCERLQDLNQNLSAHYVLGHNIDCTETTSWNGGQGFIPIGGDSSHFIGTIDGAGYTIDGLQEIRADDDPDTTFYNDPANNQDYVGLIGYGGAVTITDLHLTNAKIKGYQFVGGLVGFMDSGTITNSSVNLTTANNSCAPGNCIWARYGEDGGGLVGYMYGGTISGSSVGGPVKGSGNVIGGLVGYAQNGAEISNSSTSSYVDGGTSIGGAVGVMYDSTLYRVSTTGNIIAKQDDEVNKPGYYAGGLIGQGGGNTIEQSYATGDVHSDYRYAGGLGGYLYNTTITDAYATGAISSGGPGAGGLIGESESMTLNRVYASGTVQGDNLVGGLLGWSYNNTINDSFAAGQVTGSSSSGGFIDSSNSDVLSKNYYDVYTTGRADCGGSGSLTGCTGINSANSEPNYLIDYANEPFTQSSSRVWAEGVWYFSGTHYPVLRMGTNNTASARPFVDDNDGISAAVENAGPNGGDGNNDGIQDSAQPNVVSFINSVTNKYVTIAVDSECSVTSASSASEAANAKADDGYSYPQGLLHYTVNCGTPGFTTPVTIYYYGLTSTSGLVARKYNSTTKTYTTISSTMSGSNPVALSYTIMDGGTLDEDGTANGTIVDPIGLAAQDVPGAPNTGVEHIVRSVIPFIGIGLLITSIGGGTFALYYAVRRVAISKR